MSFVAADELQSSYDVIVVGSGAGGGQSAYTLSMDGAKVLMLEAGRRYSATESSMFRTPDLAPLGLLERACSRSERSLQSGGFRFP